MENNKINKRTIFDINGDRISDRWDDISLEGLVRGELEYYLVRCENLMAIFCKGGKQVSEWWCGIRWSGIILGQSEYYVVEWKGKEAIFHVREGRKSNWWDDIYIYDYGVIDGSSRDLDIVKKLKKGIRLVLQ